MPGNKTPVHNPKRLDLEDGPTKYVDRPANEGKHDDAAQEPNEGFPESDEESKSTHAP